MADSKPKTLKTNKILQSFIQEVTETLLEGKRVQVRGLGTFSICTRKATSERASCKMAMFRASLELREYSSGGPLPSIPGPHAKAVGTIIEAMQSEDGINIPSLGRMAVVPVPGKKPKLIFHGANELNDALSSG